MSDLHILFLPSWYSYSRFPMQGIFFKEQALALQRAGLKVGFIYPEIWGVRTLLTGTGIDDPPRFQTSISEYDGLVEVRLKGIALGPTWPWVTTWSAHRLLGEYSRRFGRPDLVHAHVAVWAGVAASYLPLPYILTEHWTGYREGLLSPWQEPLVRRAFRKAQARLAVSSTLARDIEPYTHGLPVEIVPNVVDTEFFAPAVSRLAPLPFRLVTVAILEQRKRIDLIIRALAYLVRNGQNMVLDIGGDGPERRVLEQLARDLGVTDRVTFLGPLSREQVRRAMQGAHLFVLPSEYETFGIVYIEAMACGLPVIATRCGGPEGFVTPDVGCLVPQSDEIALATAIHDVFVNYHRFDGNKIRSYVVRRFGSDAVAKKLITIYERVVSRRAMGR